LDIFKKISELIGNRKKETKAPLLIIKKEPEDSTMKEYISIEEAINDLEKDPNVPSDLLAKLKKSYKNLKNKSSIIIKDGEII